MANIERSKTVSETRAVFQITLLRRRILLEEITEKKAEINERIRFLPFDIWGKFNETANAYEKLSGHKLGFFIVKLTFPHETGESH